MFSIGRFQRFESRFEGRTGFSSEVTVGSETLLVSRYVGESEWVIDGLFRNGLPVFYNGEGSRVTRLHFVQDSAIVFALDRHFNSRLNDEVAGSISR